MKSFNHLRSCADKLCHCKQFCSTGAQRPCNDTHKPRGCCTRTTPFNDDLMTTPATITTDVLLPPWFRCSVTSASNYPPLTSLRRIAPYVRLGVCVCLVDHLVQKTLVELMGKFNVSRVFTKPFPALPRSRTGTVLLQAFAARVRVS